MSCNSWQSEKNVVLPENITKSITDSVHHPTKTLGIDHMTLGMRQVPLSEDASVQTIKIITNL